MNRRVFIGMASLLTLSAAALAGVSLLNRSSHAPANNASDGCCGACENGCACCTGGECVCDSCGCSCSGDESCSNCRDNCGQSCDAQQPKAGCCDAEEAAAPAPSATPCCAGGN